MMLLRLTKTKDQKRHEKLERLKRWPRLKWEWMGKKVRIWSGEHDAYWRPGGHGYTSDGLEAGIFEFEDAIDQTYHCGPEKRIEFKMV